MNRQELVTALENAGLSPYQADAYVAVLELGTAQATAVADASDVPDPRIYDVLRNLASEGYVEVYEQDSLHVRANSLDPMTADLEERAEQFMTAVDEIEHRWNDPPINDSAVTIVRKFETVLKNAIESVRSASVQVQVSLSVDAFHRLYPALAEATDNGVTVHLSIHTANGPETLPSTEKIADVCSEARYRELPAPFTVIVDRTETFFAPHTGSTNEYGILVNDRTHTYVFHWYFLTTQWDVWEHLYDESSSEPPIRYVDIRYCVQDIRPLVDAGDTVMIRVEGSETDSGSERVVEGEVVDVLTSDATETAAGSITSYAGQVGMTIDTGFDRVSVGGLGAMVEDVEAHRITVLSVE
ncbi:MAG: putative transcriptional regulator [Haloquadratum walsbyi J07HQW1]|jgi:Predicted transcriptional regulators|uniref:Putative transcriptional regulator n=1 Tax=Haloquadratum walsbyi J07HQW1 TaxID=1238424 RepID=U1N5P8_9EURY|nr:MAG: putative transcriptional regulator [Haloquadratum walsbyi J07HQW1]